MNLKTSLILLTLISVICDTMILPFYPQFFSVAFGVNNAMHTGIYIAASCITVMCLFPFWAKVSKRVNEVHLWVYTQLASMLLGLSCYWVNDIVSFWLLSQLMLAFKASYLLIYPFVMRLESRDKHLGVASLFSVLMHFGAIGGALVGGVFLQWFSPKTLYLVMALGDALQVVVCLCLIQKYQISRTDIAEVKSSEQVIAKPSLGYRWFSNFRLKPFVLQIGLLSLLFYFAAFAIRPFLSLYWENIAQMDHRVISGLVYSLPAWVALLGLYINLKQQRQLNVYQRIYWALVWAILGCLIQSSSNEWFFITGRLIFAWGLFQITVNLEVLLFKLSQPEDFASDYSQVHLFQNIGVILASVSTAYLVAVLGGNWAFYLAALLLVVTLITFVTFYRKSVVNTLAPTLANQES
jgi:predicted MFS family arabinose efflux permease